MGVESKIRELLEGKLQDDAVEVLDELAANRPLDKSGSGDATPPTQGNSNPNPEMQDLSGSSNPEGGLTSPVGKEASAKAGSAPRPSNSGAGKAPNYSDGEATQSVVAQSSYKGNVHQEEVEETEDEVLEETPEVAEDEVVTESEEEIGAEEEVVEGEEVEDGDGEEEGMAEAEEDEVEAAEEESTEAS